MTLTAVPPKVDLAAGESARVVVLLRNSGPRTIGALWLQALAPRGVDAFLAAPPADSLPPGAGMAWSLELERRGSGRPGEVHLVLEYSEGGGGSAVPGAAVATVAVEDHPPEKVETVARVSVSSALAVLENPREAALVFLVVTNLSDVPLEVTAARPWHPDFIEVEPAGRSTAGDGDEAVFALPLAIPPAHSRVLPFRVAAQSAVVPGDQVALWEVELGWERGGRRFEGSLWTEHRFQVRVLGEAALLEAVKVPSLMVLPGVLILLTLSFLRRRLYPRVKSGLGFASPEFWLIAVALSMLSAYLYPTLTGDRRSYLSRYGLQDIFNIWLGAMVAGLLLYLLGVGGEALVRRGRAAWERWQKRRAVPAPGDGPLAILGKLARGGQRAELPQVAWQVDGQTQHAFILLEVAQGRLWVAPPMRLEWSDEATVEFRQSVLRALGKADPGELAGVLAKGEKKKQVRIHWKAVGPLGLHGPLELDEAETPGSRRLAARRIVEP